MSRGGGERVSSYVRTDGDVDMAFSVRVEADVLCCIYCPSGVAWRGGGGNERCGILSPECHFVCLMRGEMKS